MPNFADASAQCSLAQQPERKLMIKALAIACVTLPVIVTSAIAQQTGVKRTVIRTIDYPAGYTTVTAIVELGPGTCAGRHTHPGIDNGSTWRATSS
ncbi:MAG: hypothetical protein WBL84_28835 [Xanthobacteraceae bacterium]